MNSKMIYLIMYFKIPERIKPNIPSTRIPIADTLATIQYSFFDGFLRACHTLLHFKKNDVNVIL